jgi:hypothetical protein
VIQIDKTRYPPQPPPVLINEREVAVRFNLGFIQTKGSSVLVRVEPGHCFRPNPFSSLVTTSAQPACNSPKKDRRTFGGPVNLTQPSHSPKSITLTNKEPNKKLN